MYEQRPNAYIVLNGIRLRKIDRLMYFRSKISSDRKNWTDRTPPG